MSVFRLGNELVSYLPQVVSTSKPFTLGRAGITYANKNYIIKPERYINEWSYQYIISGKGHLDIEGETFELKKGDIFLLPRGKDHCYTADAEDPWIKIWFCFNGNLARKIMNEYRVENIYHIENLDLYNEFREMFNISCRRKEGLGNIYNNAAVEFLKIVQKIAEHKKVFEVGNSEAYRIKEYIEANLMKNITLQDMADNVCLSRSQTIRVFKEVFGESPYEYFMENKISYAANLVKNSEQPIKAIAYQFGFEDENYFSRVFKQKLGCSPRQFRKSK